MALSSYDDVLKSYIQDDDKLVTYKWLSKELDLHVNTAKDILNQYWKKYKDTNVFNATILLVGRLKDQSIRVEVVKDYNLNFAKSKFSKIDCEHVYSLQKSLENLELLAFAGEGNFQLSAIKYNNEYIRNNEEVDDLVFSNNIEIQKTCKQSKEKDTVTKSTSEKEITSDKLSPMLNKAKLKNDNVKTQGKERSKNNQVNKNHTIEETYKSSSVVDNQRKQNKQEDIFTKSKSKKEIISEKSLSVSNKSKLENNNVKKQDKERSKNNQVNKNHTIEEVYKRSSVVNNQEDDNLKSTKKNDVNRKKRNRSVEHVPSKRKRIVTENFSDDSENSSKEEENDEEDIEQENDEENKEENEKEKMDEKTNKVEQSKIITKMSSSRSTQNINSKHIIRKTVDKTFQDEDGYLVTKRIHVHEVDVNNEKSEEIKIEQPCKPKSSETKAKKQSTLLNFFKKT